MNTALVRVPSDDTEHIPNIDDVRVRIGLDGSPYALAFCRRVQDFQAWVLVLEEEGDGAEVCVRRGSVLRLVGVGAGVGG